MLCTRSSLACMIAVCVWVHTLRFSSSMQASCCCCCSCQTSWNSYWYWCCCYCRSSAPFHTLPKATVIWTCCSCLSAAAAAAVADTPRGICSHQSRRSSDVSASGSVFSSAPPPLLTHYPPEIQSGVAVVVVVVLVSSLRHDPCFFFALSHLCCQCYHCMESNGSGSG